MKKVLFISDFLLEPNVGAHMLTKSHLNVINQIYGKSNVDTIVLTGKKIEHDNTFQVYYSYNNKLEKLVNTIQMNYFYINNNIINVIIDRISEKDYSIIFIDNSMYGRLIKRIKNKFPQKVVLCFYHDIKRNLSKQWLKKFGVNYLPIHITTIYNEWLSAKYSNYNITLNKRESLLFEKYYHKKTDLEIPIILEDKVKKVNLNSEIRNEFNLLFVGAYYYPNVRGIIWFIRNVMPKLNNKINLNIVGKGMENLLNDISTYEIGSNIHIIGEVQDLSEWYNKADIVIGPIFEGAGMKVKSAEALMYGKTYIGTKEALEGYIGLDDNRCDTAVEFIDKINMYYNKSNKFNRYNIEARKLYSENYSIESAKRKLQSLLRI